MERKEKEKTIERNKKITDSIYISQGRESNKGFNLFETHIAALKESYQYPNVFSLKTEEDRVKAQAKVELCEEFLNYLDRADTWAFKPKVDPETGEEEKIRKKK